jgi:hypothetical protein
MGIAGKAIYRAVPFVSQYCLVRSFSGLESSRLGDAVLKDQVAMSSAANK